MLDPIPVAGNHVMPPADKYSEIVLGSIAFSVWFEPIGIIALSITFDMNDGRVAQWLVNWTAIHYVHVQPRLWQNFGSFYLRLSPCQLSVMMGAYRYSGQWREDWQPPNSADAMKKINWRH